MTKRINAATTIEHLMANPNDYGVPTFEQFKMSREKYLGRSDDAMVSITDGPKAFRKDLKKIKFKVHGMDIETHEAVEKILGDHGYGLADLDLENRNSRLKKTVNMVPLGGGKFDVVIDLLP